MRFRDSLRAVTKKAQLWPKAPNQKAGDGSGVVFRWRPSYHQQYPTVVLIVIVECVGWVSTLLLVTSRFYLDHIPHRNSGGPATCLSILHTYVITHRCQDQPAKSSVSFPKPLVGGESLPAPSCGMTWSVAATIRTEGKSKTRVPRFRCSSICSDVQIRSFSCHKARAVDLLFFEEILLDNKLN